MKPISPKESVASLPPEPAAKGKWLWWCLLITGAIIGCILVVWQQPDQPQKNTGETWAEVSRSDLILLEDRLCQVGHTNPFTGFMVEFYVDQTLKSRSMISNGLLHGFSKGWHTNGQLSVREFFKGGFSHGQRTKWYDTGAKLSDASIVEGQLHGTYQRWHENGALAVEMQMNQGKAEGISRAYYASGFLKAEVNLEDGNPVQQQFWNDGERKRDIASNQ